MEGDLFILGLDDIDENAKIFCNRKTVRRENKSITVDSIDVLCYGLTIIYPAANRSEEPFKFIELEKEVKLIEAPLLLVEEIESVTNVKEQADQKAEENETLTINETETDQTEKPITQQNQFSIRQMIPTINTEEQQELEEWLRNLGKKKKVKAVGTKSTRNPNQLSKKDETQGRISKRQKVTTAVIDVGNNLEPPASKEAPNEINFETKIIDVGNNLEPPAIISRTKNKKKLCLQEKSQKLLFLFTKEPYRIRAGTTLINTKRRLMDCSTNPSCRVPSGQIFQTTLPTGDGTNPMKFAKSNAQYITQFFRSKYKFRNKLLTKGEDKIF
jgi:hypothetical protein